MKDECGARVRRVYQTISEAEARIFLYKNNFLLNPASTEHLRVISESQLNGRFQSTEEFNDYAAFTFSITDNSSITNSIEEIIEKLCDAPDNEFFDPDIIFGTAFIRAFYLQYPAKGNNLNKKLRIAADQNISDFIIYKRGENWSEELRKKYSDQIVGLYFDVYGLKGLIY